MCGPFSFRLFFFRIVCVFKEHLFYNVSNVKTLQARWSTFIYMINEGWFYFYSDFFRVHFSFKYQFSTDQKLSTTFFLSLPTIYKKGS